MEYVGIDVYKNQSQICLITDTGEVLHQRIHTQRERRAAVLALSQFFIEGRLRYDLSS